MGVDCLSKRDYLEIKIHTDQKFQNWHGFLPERVSSLGSTFIELKIVFEPGEVVLTSELFEAWQDSLPSERRQFVKIVPPTEHLEVQLRFENGRLSSPQGFGAVNQFLGRYYIKALKDIRPEFRIGLLTKSGIRHQATEVSTKGTECETGQRNKLTRGLR